MRFRIECALVLLVFGWTTRAGAQVFRVQGGESTLLNAEGGSIEFKAPLYDGSLGLGFYNGKFLYGGNTRYQFHGYTMLAGDESIPFMLPTDIFDPSHYFSARGIGATRATGTSRFYAFAGATSTGLGTGFFSAATSERPAGIFLYERKWDHHLKFFSRNILSNKQTSLEGVEWQPYKWMSVALTGGTGSNEKYLATSLDVESQKLAFKASYVETGQQFRRVTVISPLSSEVNKGNVQILYKPNDFVSLTTGHENILQPLVIDGPMQQATVNHLSTDFHFRRFYFGSGLFSSNASGRSTQGQNFYLGRRIGQRLEVNTNYFQSKPQAASSGTAASASTVLSGSVRENFSSRISLLQLVSRTAGQTTFAFGGDFTSNRVQVRADYQNVYLPFRPMNPFEQALALNVMVRVAGPFQVNVASNVAPDGRIRYSFGASTWLYRQKGMAVNAVSRDSFSISKYLIQGAVRDEEGLPVEGAALEIGKEVVYTDSSGRFQLRCPKHGPYSFGVAAEEFLSSLAYEVVTAPAQVRAESDELVSDIKVTVRHRQPAK